MAFQWPEHRDPVPIDARRTWTATFDSYDQRTDDVYHVALLHEDGAEAAEFMLKVDVGWTDSLRPDQSLADELARAVGALAARGETNTTCRGSGRRPPRGRIEEG